MIPIKQSLTAKYSVSGMAGLGLSFALAVFMQALIGAESPMGDSAGPGVTLERHILLPDLPPPAPPPDDIPAPPKPASPALLDIPGPPLPPAVVPTPTLPNGVDFGSSGTRIGGPGAGPLLPDTPVRLRRVLRPGYPDRARRDGIEGSVLVAFAIGRDGRAKDIRILAVEPDGYRFDRVVRRALETANYMPATRAGRPVEVLMTQRFEFRLD